MLSLVGLPISQHSEICKVLSTRRLKLVSLNFSVNFLKIRFNQLGWRICPVFSNWLPQYLCSSWNSLNTLVISFQQIFMFVSSLRNSLILQELIQRNTEIFLNSRGSVGSLIWMILGKLSRIVSQRQSSIFHSFYSKKLASTVNSNTFNKSFLQIALMIVQSGYFSYRNLQQDIFIKLCTHNQIYGQSLSMQFLYIIEYYDTFIFNTPLVLTIQFYPSFIANTYHKNLYYIFIITICKSQHHSSIFRYFFFFPIFFSMQSSPSSPQHGCSLLRSMCKQIHNFFSESYFTHGSPMQCSLSSAPDTILDTFSSPSSSLTYCDSFSNQQMSALVPTPLGNLAAASLTRVRIVTQAGRSFFSIGWSLGFPESTEIFLATGATVTLRPSSQLQIQGLVGLRQRLSSCLRQLCTHSAFLGFTVKIFLQIAAILRSPLSSFIASSSSWVLILEQLYLQYILLLNWLQTSSSISSRDSVAQLFSDIISTSRSSIDSTALSSLQPLSIIDSFFAPVQRCLIILFSNP